MGTQHLRLLAACCIFVLIVRGRPAQTKQVKGRVLYTSKQSGDNRIHYLTQFGCDIGRCEYDFRVRLAGYRTALSELVPSDQFTAASKYTTDKQANLELRIFLDEEWESPKLSSMSACERAEKARVHRTFHVPLDHNWSGRIKGSLSQTIRPHVWYFVVDDCQEEILNNAASFTEKPKEDLRATFGKKTSIYIEWESILKQENGSHFSYEYLGTHKYVVLSLIAFIGLFAFLAGKEIREMRLSGGLLHSTVQILNVAMLSQIVSLVLHLFHLLAFSRNGVGIWAFDTISECLGALSQLTMAFLLIFVGLGVSLTAPQWAHTQLSVGIALVVTLLQLILLGIDKWVADPRYKFHALEGVVGWFIVVLRICLWAVFFLCIIVTRSQPKCPKAVSHFLFYKFLPAGSLYLLAFPLIYFITSLFAAYLRHKVLLLGTLGMQLVSLWWLASLFLLRSSDYFSVSERSLGLLPGGFFTRSGGVYRHHLD